MMKNLLIALLLVIVLGGLVVSTLIYTDVIKLRPEVAVSAVKPPEGSVRVPISARQIPAYGRVTRDDLLNAKTGRLETLNLVIEPGRENPPITDIGEIIGRVLKRPKAVGYVFTEADFFPPGTQAGESAGVPAGKRAVVLDVSRVSGIRDVKPGNRIDLVAAQLIDPKASSAGSRVLTNPSAVGPDAGIKRAAFKVLVEDAVVVTQATARQIPVTTGSKPTSAAQTKTRSVEEVMIAIDPAEVPGLTQALATGAQIVGFLHSGQPRGSQTPVGSIPELAAPLTPETPEAPVKARVIEKRIGKKVELIQLPPMTESFVEPAAGDTGGAK
jgi:Flp pilus assembly protein CpaB